ncbi:hypothetical protein ACHAXT_003932 [Thalassiosira profunda]
MVRLRPRWRGVSPVRRRYGSAEEWRNTTTWTDPNVLAAGGITDAALRVQRGDVNDLQTEEPKVEVLPAVDEEASGINGNSSDDGRKEQKSAAKASSKNARVSAAPDQKQSVPDTTGAVVAVSAEETRELTQDAERRKRGPQDKPTDPDQFMSPAVRDDGKDGAKGELDESVANANATSHGGIANENAAAGGGLRRRPRGRQRSAPLQRNVTPKAGMDTSRDAKAFPEGWDKAADDPNDSNRTEETADTTVDGNQKNDARAKLEDIERPSPSKEGRPDTRGLSWASLIAMESERKEKEAAAHEDFQTKTSGSSSNASHSKASRRSRRSQASRIRSSRQSKASKASSRSNRDPDRRDQSGIPNNVSWMEESHFSVTSNKDPAYIRRQAKERFERGLVYAKRGRLTVAQERFAIALRYRVMRRGPTHPDVAAVHEMLGHVNYLLSEEADAEDDLVAYPVPEDTEVIGKDSMLGWDAALQGSGKSKKSMAYLEKACKHYRTVLDMLGAEESVKGAELHSDSGSSDNDDDSLDWSAAANAYSGVESSCDGDDDDASKSLSEDAIAVIVARVKRRLNSLPDAVRTRGNKSYASSFLEKLRS